MGKLTQTSPVFIAVANRMRKKGMENTSVYIGIVLVLSSHIPPLKVGIVKFSFRVSPFLLISHGLMCVTGIHVTQGEMYRKMGNGTLVSKIRGMVRVT